MDVPKLLQSKISSRFGWLVLLLLCSILRCSAFPALGDEVTQPAQLDAELADVCFVDTQRGWAVGDRGVIWHTRDAGRSWYLQPSHVSCRLNCVYFLDAEHGWGVGGWTQPFTHVSQGVILRTRDGGRTWAADRNSLIPQLLRIKFFDLKTGFAIGLPSALYPSGVFTTEDGGASWTPLPAQDNRAWTTGDFLGLNTGALAGHAGALGVVRRRTAEKARFQDLGLRGLKRMELQGPSGGWLVGEGGLVLTTGDLGQSWQTTAGALPIGATQHFDFQALAVKGDQIWVAGSPGTRIFHSPDAGKTWIPQPTNQFAPLQAIHFADERTGWAVGSLGTILVTDDGGKTWVKQRSGGSRAAVLGLFGEPSKAPLELAASLGGSEGYLTQFQFLIRRDLDPQAGIASDLPLRAHAAVVEAGGSGSQTAWQFPLRQEGLNFAAEQLVATLDLATDGRSTEKLSAHIVKQIRTWRPEIIVTHYISPRGDDPLNHLLNQLVLQAVEQAADSTRFVELTTEAGLPAWQVKKTFAVLATGERSTTSIDTLRLDPRLGCAVADVVSGPRGLVSPESKPVPAEIPFRLLLNNLPQDRGREDFFSGIALSPGGEARRTLREGNFDSFQQLRRSAQLRRNVQQLITSTEENPTRTDAWAGQLADLTRGLEPAGACQVLYQLAGNYVQSGRWDLAADTYQALVDRHPQHPLAATAQTWLVQYYASGEAAWRTQRRSTVMVRQAAVVAPATQGVLQTSANEEPRNIATRDTTGPVGDRNALLFERLETASRLGKHLEQTQPILFSEPSIRFPLAAAHRRMGQGGEAERYYLSLRRTRVEDAWRNAAEGEEWLGRRQTEPPKSICRVQPAGNRPHLDGKLDEPFWQAARPVTLRSSLHDDQEWPATAVLTYDAEHLYVGIVCGKAAQAKYADPPATPREHDADLTAHDRIDLLLDIDRDFATYYRLSVDQRGLTNEACWGDVTWNPTWYVASHRNETSWTIEAAIPLAELTGQPPRAGQAWCAGIQRTIPGVGFQSWTQPAGTQIQTEGFGYLTFE